MKTYIAGPMTGLPDLNFPAFHATAKYLRSKGRKVVNPAEINPDATLMWHECMRKDIAALVTSCDSIYLLPGWECSKGATLEHHIAERLGFRIEFGAPPEPEATELQRLRGEAGVMRGLLTECASVLECVDPEDEDEGDALDALAGKVAAAIRGAA
jgi:hypothetical protein